jgi:tRNA (guanine-N7-)-methyltransferase
MPAPDRQDGAPWRNFYGRRFGKTLRKGQVAHLETTLTALSVPGVDWSENPKRVAIDPTGLFGRAAPLWLEIGFGGGEHLLHQAGQNPGANVIGCEPFINGVAMLVPRLAQSGLTNVRVHPGDVRDLLDLLPPASVDKVFLLYPDPWPKSRHHKRRFVNPEFLQPLAAAMRPGAEFRIATDIADYVRQSLEQVSEPLFSLVGQSGQPWCDWTPTRYETKALREGRTPIYLTFSRR